MQLWSFYSNEHSKFADKQMAIDYALASGKPFKYTHGLGYRNPTTHNKPISLEEATKIMTEPGEWLDIDERDDCIHLNTYSSNDMW